MRNLNDQGKGTLVKGFCFALVANQNLNTFGIKSYPLSCTSKYHINFLKKYELLAGLTNK